MFPSRLPKLTTSTLLIIGCILLLSQCAEAVADENEQRLRRIDALIDAPRVTHSLEWAVDSSDVIVTAVSRGTGKPPELKSVLKPDAKTEVSWPANDQERFQAILDLYQPGDKILFCLRFDKAGKSPQLYHFFPLISLKDPRRRLTSDEYYYSLPATLNPTSRMYAFRRWRHAGFGHLTIDKAGRVIQDSDELLKRVTERIAAGSRVPADCDRNAVEQYKSEYGGFYIYVPLDEPSLSADDFPMVLVPPEPEYRQHFTRTDKNGLLSVSARLVNYRDAEVIALLKATLADRTVTERATRVSDGGSAGWKTYFLEQGQAPKKLAGEDEGKIKVVRTYEKRKLAYEHLKRMGVEVEQPELIPK